MNREVTYPLRPFLGTIVTAPERGVENTLVSQGPWGGNIDCRDVRKGNRVMLNAYHDGGLLFFGDAHGAQGDSEYTGLADETAADTVARCHVVARRRRTCTSPPTPTCGYTPTSSWARPSTR